MTFEDQQTPRVDPEAGAAPAAAPVTDAPGARPDGTLADAGRADAPEAPDAPDADAEVVDASFEEEVDEAEETPDEETPEEPDYKDLYLRSAAEMDNLRKRARRDVGIAEGRGIGRLAKELLPALDNLDRALAAAEALEGDDEHTLTRGTRLVQAELAAALERVGIKVEIPLGAPFDPHRHEALTQQPRENVAPGLVIEVYQPGYVYDDTVLRAAKVVVSA
jgi:molecular chaperone GrpE